MKKYWTYLLFISAIFLVISGCSKQDESNKRREVSKDIDSELVKKLSGVWLGEGEKENKIYNIIDDKNSLGINGDELEVTNTDNNWVKSQTKSDKIFFYDFEITKGEVTVYPSFPVEKGQVEGVLAPIKLKPIESKEIEVNYFEPDEVKAYEEALAASLLSYDKKEVFSLKITRFTKEGDPIIEVIHYDGDNINYYFDNSADKFGEKEIINATYKQMKYEKKIEGEDTDYKQFLLFDPVSKESEKEVIFDLPNVD